MSCTIDIWNMKDTFRGDTFKEKILTLPFDITGCTFLMQFRKNVLGINNNPVAFEWKSSDDSFEITDAVNGKLKMNKKVISVDPETYVSDFQITFLNGDIETLFSAKIKVNQDISRT